MKIGDNIWLFDMNRRVYPETGGIGRSPIYSGHFYKSTIDGETSRSWIVNGSKFPKNNPRGIYTDKQKEDKIWQNENRYKIVSRVDVAAPELLRQIGKLVGIV